MNDFADWLSPILVKELRQGMRARAFMTIFLCIQFFMIVCVLVSLSSEASSRDSVAGLFWTIIGIAILFLMPLRGLATLNGEMKGNTLELMMLTQLSAWRITAGKWLALTVQTLLLVCAVLPYVVLRYFLGGVNLVDDLTVLGWMLIGSALVTAGAVGISPFMQSVIGRVGMGFGFIFMPYALLIFIVDGMRGMHGGGTVSPSMTTWLLAAALLGPLLVLEFFELGVGKIAPAAENHGTRKRLIAVVLFAIAAILGRTMHEPGLMLTLASIAVAPICLGALLEETAVVPRIYRPFVRWRFIGRLVGRALYPGWASGLLFFLLFAVAFFWLADIKWNDKSQFFKFVAAVEGIFVPLALIRFFLRRRKKILPIYFGVQVLLFVTAIILSANFNNSDPNIVWTGFLPTIGFFVDIWRNGSGDQMLVFSLVLTLVSLLGLFVLSLKEWRTVTEMEREAVDLK